jgi:hypothetical protein
MDINMKKITTIPFEEFEIDEMSDFESENVKTNLDGLKQEINISFSDCNLYVGKMEYCVKFLNEYFTINIIAKKAIKEAFLKNRTVNYYFECHFDILENEILLKVFGTDTFDQFNIHDTIDRLPAPDILFLLNNGNVMVSVDYKVSKEYSDEILCVKMDMNFNVIGFSHES